jgi:hypothetical protein
VTDPESDRVPDVPTVSAHTISVVAGEPISLTSATLIARTLAAAPGPRGVDEGAATVADARSSSTSRASTELTGISSREALHCHGVTASTESVLSSRLKGGKRQADVG